MRLTIRHTAMAGAALAVTLSGGCRLDPQGPLNARASDEWVRTYTLAPDAELQIVAADGSVEVVGADVPSVEVRAERVGLATTDEGARALVPRIKIREDMSPERLVIQTEGLGGVVIGVKVQVNYRVTVPKRTRLRVRTADGPATVTALEGPIVVSAANGNVSVTDLTGTVDARAVNGRVSATFSALGASAISLRATNGPVELAVPASADATLLLNVTNGRISTDGLTLEPMSDPTPSRVRARLNKGGAPLEASAVNGEVRVRPRP